MEKAPKAYKNREFLSSRAAREIRILAECVEPRDRFQRYGVNNSIVFFGSARIQPQEELDLLKMKAKTTAEKRKIAGLELMTKYYNDAEELAYKLAKWTDKNHGREDRYYICTGGGPGIMEAANKGAHKYKSDLSVGLNISLPFEQEPNDFIASHLNFEFHYFFTRKFWFLKLAKALIVFPGGFGTMDELFELLTLIQTKKIKEIPIILYGKEFWEKLVNFDYLVETSLINESDLKLFRMVSDPADAYSFLKKQLEVK